MHSNTKWAIKKKEFCNKSWKHFYNYKISHVCQSLLSPENGNCKSYATYIKAVTAETLFAVRTVHIVFALNGKYKAKNFSVEIMASRADE